MYRQKNYVHDYRNFFIPSHLNFGKYLLDRLPNIDTIAIENIDTKKKLTYKEVREYAVNFAISLAKMGIQKGDIVAVGTEKRKECVPLVLAVLLTGATMSSHDISSGRGSFQHKIKITRPKYFICSDMFLEQYHEIINGFDCVKMIITLDKPIKNVLSLNNVIRENVDLELFEPSLVSGETDVAFILFSSGTTGLSKGAQLTHLSCIIDNISDDDDTFKVAYLSTDGYDCYGNYLTFKLLLAGKKVLLSDDWCTKDILQSIQDYQVNILFLWPSCVSYLIKEEETTKYNLSHLKLIYTMGSSLHKTIIGQVKQKYPHLQYVMQGYGMTEIGIITSSYRVYNCNKEESVGKAVPGITVKVSDLETRESLGPNKHGEICVWGPKVTTGYIGVDIPNYLDKEGFFKTGDLGYYDDDGFLYIVGRVKEIIDYESDNVSPMELEMYLQLHPGVRDAGVVGKPDPDYGELPTAFVVKQPGATVTEQELVDYIAQEVEVPDYMQLRGGVRFIEDIPRNSRGKILRRKLKEMLN